MPYYVYEYEMPYLPLVRGAAATGIAMRAISRLRVRCGMIEKVEFGKKMMGDTITHHIDKHIKLKYR
jgi:hypothetical protein